MPGARGVGVFRQVRDRAALPFFRPGRVGELGCRLRSHLAAHESRARSPSGGAGYEAVDPWAGPRSRRTHAIVRRYVRQDRSVREEGCGDRATTYAARHDLWTRPSALLALPLAFVAPLFAFIAVAMLSRSKHGKPSHLMIDSSQQSTARASQTI